MPPETPRTLLIGYEYAWTTKNQGAIVAALHHGDGIWHELGNPQPAAFFQARDIIQAWRDQCRPSRTLILLDQPTIVPNPTGQRPVEHIVSSAISLRFGGVQPASTSRSEMFGASAPIWRFLTEHGNITDPFRTPNDITVQGVRLAVRVQTCRRRTPGPWAHGTVLLHRRSLHRTSPQARSGQAGCPHLPVSRHSPA